MSCPRNCGRSAGATPCELAHERFRADTQGLIKALQQALQEIDAPRQTQAENVRRAQAEAERKRHEHAANERAKAHRAAMASGDVAALASFLASYPKGSDADQVRGRLRGLEPQHGRRVLRSAIVMAGALAAAFLGALLLWVETRPPTPVTQPPPTAQPAPTPIVTPPTPVPQPLPSAFAPLPPERERALQPKDTFTECENCPQMVVMPAGSFTMGSPASETGRGDDEGPQHVVAIKRPFAVGKFEVTVGQFSAFVTETGYDAGSKCWVSDFAAGKAAEKDGLSWRNPGFAQTGAHPAVCLNWNDARAYVAWVSKKTGEDYRLLSEAEYEYAIRAKTTPGVAPRYFFGDDEASMCRYGNGLDQTAKTAIPGADKYAIFPCSDGYAYTAPAGSFSPNGFGLYDMHGNAWSWTEDCYHDSYSGAPRDGSVWTSGDCSRRVVRGGSWRDTPDNLRSANRGRGPSDDRS